MSGDYDRLSKFGSVVVTTSGTLSCSFSDVHTAVRGIHTGTGRVLGLRRGFGVVGGGCLAGGDLPKLPGNDTEISWSTTDGLESGSVGRVGCCALAQHWLSLDA